MTAAPIAVWDMTPEQLAEQFGPDHKTVTISPRSARWRDPSALQTTICSCGDGCVVPYTPEGMATRSAWRLAHVRSIITPMNVDLDSDPCPAEVEDGSAALRWCEGYRCEGPRLGYLTIEPYEDGDAFCTPSGGCSWTCETCGNDETIEDPAW